MNKDVADTTATDAAAPAIADVPPAPSDVVTVDDWFETDDELAQLALRLLNDTQLNLDDICGECEQLDPKLERFMRREDGHKTAPLPTLVLMSRALMRSAAAQERTAAIAERSERRLLETREADESMRALQLANLRLQNQAFTGEIERLTMLAQLAVGFANTVQAQALDNGAVPAEVIGEFVSSVRALSSEQAGPR